jgi:hypothetical protein
VLARRALLGSALGLWIAGGCLRTTELTGRSGPDEAPPFGPVSSSADVACASTVMLGAEGPLLDPPSGCSARYSFCSDAHEYAQECDGLSCSCLIDGALNGSFLTPRCAALDESALRCGWPVRVTHGVVSGERQGEPCDEELAAAPDGCECIDAVVDCPDRQGCFLSARWRALDGTFILALAPDGTLFSSEHPSADAIIEGRLAGYVGTWQLSLQILHLRTVHALGLEGCEQIARYRVSLSGDCSELELRAIDDACEQRAPLNAMALVRE